MLQFIYERGIGIAWGALAMAAQVSGYTNAAIALLFVAVAAFFFIAPIWHHAHSWHVRRKQAGLKSVEAAHLITFGVAGAFVFGAIALMGVLWQNLWLPVVTAQMLPKEIVSPTPPPLVLSYEQRQYRLDLRRFTLSNLAEIYDTFGRVTGAMIHSYNEDHKDTQSFSSFFEQSIVPYYTAFQAVKNIAQSDIEKLEPNDLAEAIKKTLASYQQAQGNLIQFQKEAKIDPNQNGKTREWLEADRRALQVFRDLKSSPFSSNLDGVDESVMASRTGKFEDLLRVRAPETIPQAPRSEEVTGGLQKQVAAVPQLNSEEVATKISIWESVSTVNANALALAYNAIDLALTKWPESIKSQEGRGKLYSDLVNATAAFMGAASDLETLRSAYTSYNDVVDGLAQPYRAGLAKASADFSNAVIKDPPADSSQMTSYENKLRPLAGALRREMDSIQAWLTKLGNTARSKRQELSEMR